MDADQLNALAYAALKAITEELQGQPRAVLAVLSVMTLAVLATSPPGLSAAYLALLHNQLDDPRETGTTLH